MTKKKRSQRIEDLIWFSVLFLCLLIVFGVARLIFQELEARPFGGYLVGGTFARPMIGAAAGLLVGFGWRFGWRKMEQINNGPADRLIPVIAELTDKVAELPPKLDNIESRLSDHEIRIRVQEERNR
jgi:hypothetical protein